MRQHGRCSQRALAKRQGGERLREVQAIFSGPFDGRICARGFGFSPKDFVCDEWKEKKS